LRRWTGCGGGGRVGAMSKNAVIGWIEYTIEFDEYFCSVGEVVSKL
jgi:hypothetical protein